MTRTGKEYQVGQQLEGAVDADLDTIDAIVAATVRPGSGQITTVAQLEDRLAIIEQQWTQPLVITDERSTFGPLAKGDKKRAKVLTEARDTCMNPSVTLDSLLAQYGEKVFAWVPEPDNSKLSTELERHLARHGLHR